MITPSIGFWEVRVPDLDRATAFYTAVFGLTASPWGEFVMLSTAEGAPAGSLEQVEEVPPTDGAFRPTFDSEDMEADLALVEASGGTVVLARSEIGDGYGWWAAFTDPFGNRLQISTNNPAADANG